MSLPACAHPLCNQPANGYFARLREGHYCSAVCRSRHGALLRQKARREAGLDRETTRARRLMQKYGISVADWDRLYDDQLGRCVICLTTLADVKVCVDHDHVTGEVRGLLCNVCNQGLGYFGDDAVRLQRAIDYLNEALSAPLGARRGGDSAKCR